MLRLIATTAALALLLALAPLPGAAAADAPPAATPPAAKDLRADEVGLAYRDHLAIAAWVKQCLLNAAPLAPVAGRAPAPPKPLDPEKRRRIDEAFADAFSFPAPNPGAEPPEYERPLGQFDYAVAYLTKTIRADREHFAERAAALRTYDRFLTIVGILISGIVSVVVAMKAAAASGSNWSRMVGLLALVASAIATGYASFVGFEAAGQQVARADGQLLRLGQLHRLITLELQALDCEPRPPGAARTAGGAAEASSQESFLKSWRNRYRDILETGTNTPTGGGSGQGASGR